MDDIGIVVLAAGESSRMSGSKQLLMLNGVSLLQKSVTTAIATGAPVVTVLGANFKNHKNEIARLRTEIVFNLDWKKGMGSSLKKGLHHLHSENPNLSAVIFIVCDQPKLEPIVLYNLIDTFKNKGGVVASSYNGTLGVPAIFSRDYFKELLKIEDEQGAKPLLNKFEAIGVPFSDGALDIDTDQDWQNFINTNSD